MQRRRESLQHSTMSLRSQWTRRRKRSRSRINPLRNEHYQIERFRFDLCFAVSHRTIFEVFLSQEFKLAFSEFYLSLILLQNYQNLNHTGFRKILKKHDKLLRVDIGGKWQKDKVETSHFYVNRDIDKIIHETEATVTTELESGDRQRAMKRLRVPPLGKLSLF